MGKKIKKLVKTMNEGKMPSTEELYENPIKKIVIKPKWWDLKENVLDFVEQLCEGYLWEIKFGTRFVAVHTERDEVERIMHAIQSLRHRNETKQRWVPNYDSELDLLMVDFARVLPKMWD